MANVYSTTAQNLAKIGTSVLQSCLAPVGAFVTPIELVDREAPGLTSQVALATAAADTVINPTTFDAGDCTITNVQLPSTLYSQPFGLSSIDMNSGARLDWLAALNAQKLAETLADSIFTLLTTANFGAAVVSVNPAAFGGGDFDNLFAAIPTVNKSIILDTAYFAKVKSTWLPPRFNSVFEHSRWGTAGAKVRGFVADRRAIVLRWGVPWIFNPSDHVLARDRFEIPQLGIGGEVTIWFKLQTRSVRAAYSIYLSSAVGDAAALKLLTSTD